MYRKKVIILNEVNNNYALMGQHICGMIRVTASDSGVDVTTFVTNVNRRIAGEWYVAICSDGDIYVTHLDTLNNHQCKLPLRDIDNLSCVVANIDKHCHVVCQASLGNGTASSLQPTAIYDIVCRDSTRYEELLAVTDNYYTDSSVEQLATLSASKYLSVQQYSTAFERYYATSRDDNYYDSVKGELTKVLVQFPPYHPLIEHYDNSYFVRIDFVNSNSYFALGVVQRQGLVAYLCYALPSSDSQFHDKDFTYITVEGKGYYVLYQDAVTGQITTMPTNEGKVAVG